MTWKYVIHCNANNCTYRHIYIHTYDPLGRTFAQSATKCHWGLSFFGGCLGLIYGCFWVYLGGA
jgi:hypothetical protein